MAQEELILTETDLCSRYGLEKEQIKSVRKESLIRDTDWSWTPGEHVKYYRTGLEKLSNLFGIEITELAEKPLLAQIIAIPPLNRKLLIGLLDGEEIKIKVQTNARFMKGMLLKVRQDPNGEPCWYNDQPLPRYRGRY